jgi:7-cyano-7-deazaguanine synthase
MPRLSSHNYKSVVLFSGGIDSALNLALACRYRPPVLALTVDYGHRAARPEIRAARKICAFYEADHQVVKLTWFRDLVPVALVEPGAALPENTSPPDAVWVPNRNGLFIAIGAAFAERYGAPAVIAGFNAEEATDFPDNSRAFVAAVNRSLHYSTAGRVRVSTYTGGWDKTDIARKAYEAGVPLEYIYPCYGEGPRPCGGCASCRRTARALAATGQDAIADAVFGRKPGKKS